MKTITFYFDFLSPFSFFAWLGHQNEIHLTDVNIVYKPVLMGRLFSHFEFRGPGEIEVKRNYELKKCFRYAAKNQIEFHPPEVFPFNPLAIIRCATLTASGDLQLKVIDCLFRAIWQKGLILEDPELIEKVLKEKDIHGEILERSFTKEAKLELKNNIHEAINKNIFGVPTFAIDSEYFWGNDSFEDLNNYISGNDNWDRDYYNHLVEK